jgi:soluble lytic murein transglycosylase-like protein
MACMIAAAFANHLPARALPAIHAVEGGYVGSVHANGDGSHDLGMMQVNTLWVRPIASATGLPPQTVTVRLITDGCFNIAVAGRILRIYLDETHNNIWAAIGDYHSHTRGLNTVYRMKVFEEAMAMPGAKAAMMRRLRRSER